MRSRSCASFSLHSKAAVLRHSFKCKVEILFIAAQARRGTFIAAAARLS
jgi:hypothetical protein